MATVVSERTCHPSTFLKLRQLGRRPVSSIPETIRPTLSVASRYRGVNETPTEIRLNARVPDTFGTTRVIPWGRNDDAGFLIVGLDGRFAECAAKLGADRDLAREAPGHGVALRIELLTLR